MINSSYIPLSHKRKSAAQLEYGLYLIFFASLAFSLRAVSSISIGLILVFNFYLHKKKKDRWFPPLPGIHLLTGLGLLFLLESLSLLHTEDLSEGIRHLEKTSGMVLIPLAVYGSAPFLNKSLYARLMWGFAGFLFAACCLCLLQAALHYFQSGSSESFFYHELAGNIGQHAIRFSILLYLVLIFLILEFRKNEVAKRRIVIFLVTFFSFFLVLLSSKLVLLFYVFSVVLLFIKTEVKNHQKLIMPLVVLVIAGGITIAMTANPVSQRFRLLLSGDQHLYQREKFDQGIYFNGIQFRLLQWRIVPEILNRHQAWMIGVSPGDAQTELDKIYREKNMYTGKEGTADKGLLGYHTHNQFLQTLLQHGIIGLVVLIAIWFYLARMARSSKNLELQLLVVLLFLYCFTDALLETQYGMVIFCFFPFFSFLSHRPVQQKYPVKRGNPLYQSAFLP